MEAERDAFTTKIATFAPGAPENTTVANITAFNETREPENSANTSSSWSGSVSS